MQKLENLLQKTKEIKNKIESQTIDILEYNIQSIFVELNSLISKDDLKVALAIMENGTLLLEDKINEMMIFISNLLQNDIINQYFKFIPSDKHLVEIMKSSWNKPIIFPKLSIQFLNESWLKLVQNKKSITLSPKRIIPTINKKEIIQFTNNVQSFKKKMILFFNEITCKLPAKLEDLLKDYQNKESYFECFSYILHLLQNGYLIYKKSSNLIDIGEISV